MGKMFINTITHYLPETIVKNSYFKERNGLSEDWILSRTGIEERRKAAPDENTNSMAIEAVNKAIEHLPYSINDIDLIIGATYTPSDTVVTLAHAVQNKFNIDGAKAVSVSSACSSFINAVEIVEGYFTMNKANKALVVVSVHNTAYGNERDEQSGHLWGDGASAIFISKNKISDNDIEIIDTITEGLGNIGEASNAVYLNPLNGGLQMPLGKDIFKNAIKSMISILKEILDKNNLSVENLNYIIPHQANIRIIDYIAKELKINNEKTIINIDKLGNTGCASTPIALSQNINLFKQNEIIGITVFGGGYSSGAILLKS